MLFKLSVDHHGRNDLISIAFLSELNGAAMPVPKSTSLLVSDCRLIDNIGLPNSSTERPAVRSGDIRHLKRFVDLL